MSSARARPTAVMLNLIIGVRSVVRDVTAAPTKNDELRRTLNGVGMGVTRDFISARLFIGSIVPKVNGVLARRPNHR